MLDIPFALAIGLAAGFVELLGFRPIHLANAATFLRVPAHWQTSAPDPEASAWRAGVV